jgi:hypothetical protein
VASSRRRSLGALFALLAIGLAVWSALARQWIVLIAAGALGAWLAELAYRGLR